MNFPHTSVAQFFRDVSPVNFRYIEGQGYFNHQPPVSRFDFLVGGGLGVIFCIAEIGKAAIAFIGVIFTLASDANQGYRDALLESLKGVVTYAIAYPIGWAGFIAPGLINQYLLEIPPQGNQVPWTIFDRMAVGAPRLRTGSI